MRRELINGAYCLLGELKGSARASQWLAHSLVTGELVIVSLPVQGGESPTAEELRREGTIFGEITSRHVQAVVDWGAEEVFLAWEYAPAWTLSTVLRAAPPPSIGAVLRMMLELAMGLAAVHNRGAVYRGLHPGRVLVMRDGTARLATTPESVLAKRGRQIDSGPPRDTPIRYMAPEQIQGTITSRSDLYSLTVVAYELLTGKQAYSHPDPVTLAVEILETMPPPPSAHRADVPAEVDEFFNYCLSRRSEDRPRNVASMVTYLNKLINTHAGPETESLTERLGLHPVAYPLLSSDRDRAELFEAFTESAAPASEEDVSHRTRAGREAAPSQAMLGGERLVRPRTEEINKADPAISEANAVESPVGSMTWLDELNNQELATEFLIAENGLEFALHPPGMTIGRRGSNGSNPDIDVRDIDSGMVVSREHAALHYHDGVWHVLELRARNGTWVNGERLVPGVEMPLRTGDNLRLANVELEFRKRDPAVPPADDIAAGGASKGATDSDSTDRGALAEPSTEQSGTRTASPWNPIVRPPRAHGDSLGAPRNP